MAIEEFKQFYNTFKEKDFIYQTFFLLVYFTGLREGEALALKWKDLSNNKLTIIRSVSQKTDKKQMVEKKSLKQQKQTMDMLSKSMIYY